MIGVNAVFTNMFSRFFFYGAAVRGVVLGAEHASWRFPAVWASVWVVTKRLAVRAAFDVDAMINFYRGHIEKDSPTRQKLILDLNWKFESNCS